MPELPVLDHDTVLAAVSPGEAIDRVREAFVAHHRGEWVMPAKVYLDSPPHGDFRAMPARGSGLALLKWVTSFPGNPARGLPTVTGIVCLSDAGTGEPLMLLDARSITALRTGAVAAVAAQALAREDARSAGIVGCGLHGAWTARCLAAAGYASGVCYDPDADAAERLADELGWEAGPRPVALACDAVSCVTPGHEPSSRRATCVPGCTSTCSARTGPARPRRRRRCRLVRALLRRVGAGLARRRAHRRGRGGPRDARAGHRPRRGARGDAPGRPGPEAVTLFDSTGLAIQDLAVAAAAFEAWKAGRVEAQTVRL